MTKKFTKARMPIYLNSDQMDDLLLAITRAEISTQRDLWDIKTDEEIKPILRDELEKNIELLREVLTQIANYK